MRKQWTYSQFLLQSSAVVECRMSEAGSRPTSHPDRCGYRKAPLTDGWVILSQAIGVGDRVFSAPSVSFPNIARCRTPHVVTTYLWWSSFQQLPDPRHHAHLQLHSKADIKPTLISTIQPHQSMPTLPPYYVLIAKHESGRNRAELAEKRRWSVDPSFSTMPSISQWGLGSLVLTRIPPIDTTASQSNVLFQLASNLVNPDG
ncbi:hypothetical protein B0T13DRAFT_127634 [Neurospora crassa]|nr:hypothetical protein B0T13DRAFT_127634 [Neurospora crassa]